MSDEPEPTPKEIEKARALAAWIDGGKKVPHDSAVPALLAHVNRPLTDERMAVLEARLGLRRGPRWLVRAGVAASAIAASVALVWFLLGPRETLPKPTSALITAQADAAKHGRVEGVDEAMQPYRRTLLQTPELRAAEPVYARVDAALRAGNVDAAREELSALADSKEAMVLRRDAMSRLAALELRRGDADAALGHANRGLALAKTPDVFTVNLLLMRAAAHRSLGHEKEEADDLYAALVVCDTLLQALLK